MAEMFTPYQLTRAYIDLVILLINYLCFLLYSFTSQRITKHPSEAGMTTANFPHSQYSSDPGRHNETLQTTLEDFRRAGFRKLPKEVRMNFKILPSSARRRACLMTKLNLSMMN